jgi:hypothetical protein
MKVRNNIFCRTEKGKGRITTFETKTKSWVGFSICSSPPLIKFTLEFLREGVEKAWWAAKSSLGKRKVRGVIIPEDVPMTEPSLLVPRRCSYGRLQCIYFPGISLGIATAKVKRRGEPPAQA